MADWVEINSLFDEAVLSFGLVLRSARMKELFQTLRRIGRHHTTVIIEGESGTGKERVAHALHSLSAVAQGPFVAFNCSNLVGPLAESQLFGHVRGAFTDAREEAAGYFRAAHNGTLFLDEIGELPLSIQPKLLRAVENYEVQPVGSTKLYQVKVRLIAATNRDLRTMIRNGEFRSDLYYRISATRVRIPPLRDRREAIGALAAHFVGRHAAAFGRQVRFISKQALSALQDHNWPGNVRELDHTIQNAMLLHDGDRIDLDHLPIGKPEAPESLMSADEKSGYAEQPLDRMSDDNARQHKLQPLEILTREAVMRSLSHAGGNKLQAAQILGISRPKLYRLITRYGIAMKSLGRLQFDIEAYRK